MMKNKGKIFLILMLTLIVGVLFATTAFALEGENISVKFYTTGGALDKNINTSQIVQGEAQIIGGQTVKLPTRDVADGQSFNWRTEDGRCWEGGATVTFYDSTILFPITANDVSTAEELASFTSKSGAAIRLLDDIYLDTKPGFPWPGSIYIILNGKTLEINSSLGTAWGGQRAGTYFYGTGTVKYMGTGTFANMNGHGYGGDNCRLYIGAGVTIDAPNSILGYDGDGSYVSGYPYIQIYGIVNCKTVLHMQNAGNRNPRIEIYDGAQLNISGALNTHASAGNIVSVIVNGGNIKTTGTVSFFNDQNATFKIRGGSFEFANQADYSELLSKIDISQYRVIELKGSNNKVYQTVSAVDECRHEYALHSTLEACCASCTKDNFVCTLCGHIIHIAYGTKGAHVYPESPSETLQPTKVKPGWNKYYCEDCSSVLLDYLYYDPTNDKIIVVVNTGNGEKEVEAVLKEVLIIDSNYVVTGVRGFENYTIDQIVGITIPVGVAKVNISTANTSVTKITLGDGLVAEIINLKGLQNLEKIVIRNVSSVVFKNGCAPKTVTSIKSDYGGAKVEYEEGAFKQHTNLKEMTFSKNSTYIFGKQSFMETGVTSLEFIDGCNVSFKGEAAFYGSKVEYIYFGKGISSISNKPFDNAYYVQKVILMDVTSIADNDFSYMNKGENVPVVYHHAASLTLGANTFKYSHGIILYTNATIAQGFSSCTAVTKGGVEYPKYTIHYGITHAYERIEKEPTCLADGSIKYITDCPCGKNDGNSHKKFAGVLTSSTVYTIEDYSDKIKEKLPHDLSTVGKIKYTNGYTKYGYYTYTCSMCKNDVEESTPSCLPLISTYGYSVSEDGESLSMSVKYVFNEEMLRQYEKSNKVTLNYGTVVAVKKQLDGTPLDASGNAKNGVIKNSTLGYSTNEIKLVNLKDSHKAVSYVMSVYIIDGSQITYIQDTESVENPSGVSYREVKELADYNSQMALAIVPGETKEN